MSQGRLLKKVGLEWLADVSHQLQRARASVCLSKVRQFFFQTHLLVLELYVDLLNFPIGSFGLSSQLYFALPRGRAHVLYFLKNVFSNAQQCQANVGAQGTVDGFITKDT